MAHLHIRLLGPFEVTLDGELAAGFRSDKARALLAYLCVEAERPHRRERLAGLLWPDLPEQAARTNLRHALANLRRVIGEPGAADRDAAGAPVLDVTRQTVQFNAAREAEVDALAFLAGLEAPRHPLGQLEEAVEWYRGEFLEGFSLPDSAIFEEWLLLQRERFRRLALEALRRLAGGYTLRGEYERALVHAWRQVELDPLREGGHQQLMRLLAYIGRPGEALGQYEACCRVLREELGAEPAVETTQLWEQIQEGTLPIPAPSTGRLPAFLADEEGAEESEVPVFVAREGELGRLGRFLELACAGRGQVALVVGEAGSGKTALLQAFCRRAGEAHPDVLTASGKGNSYTGAGDPYLPFRQALALLMGDVEGPWQVGAMGRDQALRLWRGLPAAVEALVEAGPELVGTFLSGPALLERGRAYLRWSEDTAAGWLSSLAALMGRPPSPPGPGLQQSDLFEQYTRVLHRAAQQRGGLLLVLDDFQWADTGSIGLLFHLGRQLAGSRVLVVVAYRPEEVALGREGERHPLAPVIHQLQREYGEVQVDLDRAGGRAFVEAFLDSEPNALGEGFRERLYAQTLGHPLFTIELLRGMQERGDLVRDDAGRWVAGPELEWGTLPARTEAVIGERIGRLAGELQETLRVASVMGEEFAAEAVAQVQGVEEGALLWRLSGELDRQHRLVAARGVQRIDGERLSSYRFRHILFQKYLYEGLDEVERSHLHGRVGRALETLYEGQGEALAEIAPQLARHFRQAGLVERAVDYLQQAGERAVRMYANEEAIRHLRAGLALLETLPETAERMEQEISMQLALIMPLQAVKGYSAPEVGQAYGRARELVLRAEVGESLQGIIVLGHLGVYSGMRAEHGTALKLFEQALAASRCLDDPVVVALDHLGLGWILTTTGGFDQALVHLEKVIVLYDPQQHRYQSFRLGQGQDIGVSAHAWASWAWWFLGYPDRALQHSEAALSLARAAEHPFGLCFAHDTAGFRFHLLRGEVAQAGEHLEAEASLAAEGRFAMFQAYVQIFRGWIQAEQGQAAAGIAQMREGLTALEETGTEIFNAHMLSLLADACARAGEVAEGLQLNAQALEWVERTGERFYEAELHRLRGELLAQGSAADEAEVAGCYQQAIEVARAQQARSLELRAAMGLARLWQGQGRVKEACELLAPIYDWFSEGFDTPDLREAKALLEELG